MKKLFLIPLMACAMLFSTNLWAVNVANLDDLKAALANGGEITLTANITSGEALNITKATTIDGAGFAIKGTDAVVFSINTAEPVVVKNITLYAANASGRAIGVYSTTSNLTVDNIIANCNDRGITYYADGNDNCTLNILNSTIQYVKKNTKATALTLRTAEVDEWGNPQNINYDECAPGQSARGISLWEMKHSIVVIENSTIQGFDYDVNCAPAAQYGDADYTGTSITATNSTFKGRCAYNIHVGNAKFEFTDCKVIGINCFGGPSESFACFVMDEGANHCLLTINGGSVASARFSDNATANKNAREFMVTNRGTENEIVINNASYTCPKDLGDNKGGVIEYMSSGKVEINGGTYDCPQIVQGFYVSEGAEIVINNGDFNINTVSATDDGYNPLEDVDTYKGITIQGGTYSVDVANIHPSSDATYGLMGTGVKGVTNANGSTSVVDNAIETEAVAENTDVDEDKTVDRVDIAAGKELRVKAGKRLVVGEGGMVFGNEYSKMIVEPGATVVMQGVLYGAEASNVVIQSDATTGNQGVMLIDPATVSYGAMHPEATFEIVSRAYNDGGAGVWQRFGIPSFAAITGMTTEAAVTTYIYDFDNTKNDWRQLGKFDAAADADLLAKMNNPFACYNMICSATEPGTRYTISGKLLGNDNGALDMYTQYNAFANSYSGKINMAQLLSEMYDNDDVAVTVYAWKPAGNNSFAWEAVDLSNYDINDELHQNIQPMQCFIILAPAKKGNIALDYKKMVWNPAMGISNAPARRALPAISNKVQIVVRDANNNDDNVILLEGDRFSSANDRGYDAVKYMNENLNLYVTADEKMAHIATDNLEGQFIGMSCVEGGEFTMSFDNLNGETLVIRDMLTNATISMKEGETYTFVMPDAPYEVNVTAASRLSAAPMLLLTLRR